MKLASLLLGFCSLTAGLLAHPPYPTVLTVKYGEQLLPVVRVKGTDPFVMVDGKEVRIRANPLYFPQSVASFSENSVTAPKRPLAGSMRLELLGEHSDHLDLKTGMTMTVDFEVQLVAKDTIKGGFAMLVMYAPANYENPYMQPIQAQSVVHELPELPAGQPVNFKFYARRVPRTKEPSFFVQIYDGAGREVRTNYSSFAWKYYALRDRVRLASEIEKYLAENQGADHPAVPVITPKPVFSSMARPPQGEITVMLNVEADGTVTYVDAGMIGDDSTRNSVIESLGGWLFLPRLKAGIPVSTRIQLPLEF